MTPIFFPSLDTGHTQQHVQYQEAVPSYNACSAAHAASTIFLLLQFGVWIAYLLVAYCYFGVGFAGYHAFGSMTGSQIMYSLGHPIWVVCMANIMIIVHVCGSFQVWLTPV